MAAFARPRSPSPRRRVVATGPPGSLTADELRRIQLARSSPGNLGAPVDQRAPIFAPVPGPGPVYPTTQARTQAELEDIELAAFLEVIDRDGDGRITREEFIRGMAQQLQSPPAQPMPLPVQSVAVAPPVFLPTCPAPPPAQPALAQPAVHLPRPPPPVASPMLAASLPIATPAPTQPRPVFPQPVAVFNQHAVAAAPPIRFAAAPVTPHSVLAAETVAAAEPQLDMTAGSVFSTMTTNFATSAKFYMADYCNCGNYFMPDDAFCRKCGQPRARDMIEEVPQRALDYCTWGNPEPAPVGEEVLQPVPEHYSCGEQFMSDEPCFPDMAAAGAASCPPARAQHLELTQATAEEVAVFKHPYAEVGNWLGLRSVVGDELVAPIATAGEEAGDTKRGQKAAMQGSATSGVPCGARPSPQEAVQADPQVHWYAPAMAPSSADPQYIALAPSGSISASRTARGRSPSPTRSSAMLPRGTVYPHTPLACGQPVRPPSPSRAVAVPSPNTMRSLSPTPPLRVSGITAEHAAALFDHFDTNGDGILSREEFAAVQKSLS